MLKIGPALGRQSVSKAEGRKRLPEAFADQAYLRETLYRQTAVSDVGISNHFYSIKWNTLFHFWESRVYFTSMIVIGRDIVETYFRSRAGHRGIKAARAQYDAWLAIAGTADWKTPEEVKKAHPKASILKGGRVVFNIKANDFRLIVLIQYLDGILMIRFFGSHEEYDGIDAETV